MRSYSGSRTSFLLTAEALLKASPGLKLIKESSIEVYGPEGSTPGYLVASILGQSRLSVKELVALGQSVEERLADPMAPKARSSLRLELLWVEGVELKAPGIELPHPELFTRSWAVGTFTRAAEEAVPTKAESRRLLKALQSVQGPHEIDEVPFLAPEVELRREREPGSPATDVWTVQGTDWPDGLAAAAFVLGAIVHEREDPRPFWDPADAARNTANAVRSEGLVRVEVPFEVDASDSQVMRRWLAAVSDAVRASKMRLASAVLFEAEGDRLRGAVVGERLREPLEPVRLLAVSADRNPPGTRGWAAARRLPNVTRVVVQVDRSLGDTGLPHGRGPGR